VCYFIDQLGAAGTESQLLELIKKLNRSRFQPYLCLLRRGDAQSQLLEPDDCPILRLGLDSFRRPSSLLVVSRLIRFLRQAQIDILQTYFPESTYVGVLAGRLAGRPRIVRTRNNQGYWLTPIHRRLSRLCNRFVHCFVTNSAACRDAIRASEGLAEDRVTVLENGVDLSRFPRHLATPRPDSESKAHRRVGLLANLRAVKEPELFVRAAAAMRGSHPDVTFAIAGEGERRQAVERLVAGLGIQDRCQLLGSVADVPAFLFDLDVAVLCSSSEGMSNALLEYMAAGRAIIATAVGGNVELIENGVHGLLVPPRDVGELCGAIRRLLADPALRARLGAAARDRVEAHYSRDSMIKRFEEFYYRLMGIPLPRTE
jgi:glycosyltransferase involved in cell wall biosynthesis